MRALSQATSLGRLCWSATVMLSLLTLSPPASKFILVMAQGHVAGPSGVRQPHPLEFGTETGLGDRGAFQRRLGC